MKWRILLLPLLFWSCEDYDECDVSSLSEDLIIQFYDKTSQEPRTVEFNSIEFHHSAETISFIDTIPSTGRILPIDLTDTVAFFRFTTDTADYDFEFWYDLEAIVENPECTPIFRVKNLNYNKESLTFDSAAFRVLELTTLASPHVEVYF